MLSILTSIDETLKQQNSTRQVFIQGLIRGFGTALGATALLAIATSLTINFLSTVDLNSFASYFFTEVVDE